MKLRIRELKEIIREEVSRAKMNLQENTLISIENFRRPNGGLGTQGWTQENMLRLLTYISKVKGFDLPEHSSLRELIEGIKSSQVIKDLIFDYVEIDPIEVVELPEEQYAIRDGNHRANLLNLLGAKQLPVKFRRI